MGCSALAGRGLPGWGTLNGGRGLAAGCRQAASSLKVGASSIFQATEEAVLANGVDFSPRGLGPVPSVLKQRKSRASPFPWSPGFQGNGAGRTRAPCGWDAGRGSERQPLRDGEQMGNVRAGDQDFLIDVFCQEPFEVEKGPTSQTLSGLMATFPRSYWRQIASFPASKPVSCFWETTVGPWSFPSDVVEVNAASLINHRALP